MVKAITASQEFGRFSRAAKPLVPIGGKSQPTVKKKITHIQTDVFRNPQTPSFLKQADRDSQIRALRTDLDNLKASGMKLNVPIRTGLGPAGGVLGNIAVAATRIGLRTPGVRQGLQKIGGRITTLKPFGGATTVAGIGTALGVGFTVDAILEGVSRGLDKVQTKIGPPAGGQQLAIPQGGTPMHEGTGRSLARLPGVGGHLPAGTTIVKTWHTGTAQFARLADGRIAVQKKDGTIKVWRPQKHIVIPRNPRVGTLIRADKRLERLTKGLRKVVRSGKR